MTKPPTIQALAADDDGHFLASSTTDSTIILWAIGDDGTLTLDCTICDPAFDFGFFAHVGFVGTNLLVADYEASGIHVVDVRERKRVGAIDTALAVHALATTGRALAWAFRQTVSICGPPDAHPVPVTLWVTLRRVDFGAHLNGRIDILSFGTDGRQLMLVSNDDDGAVCVEVNVATATHVKSRYYVDSLDLVRVEAATPFFNQGWLVIRNDQADRFPISFIDGSTRGPGPLAWYSGSIGESDLDDDIEREYEALVWVPRVHCIYVHGAGCPRVQRIVFHEPSS
jgi:WD40 repeat protein